MLTGTKRLWKRISIWSASVVGVVLIAAAVYIGYLYHKADAALANIAGSEPPTANTAGNNKAAETGAKGEKPITFLLAGIDSRQGSGGTLNTDVIMLAALDPNSRAATLVSLPRDLQLKPENLPAHKANYYYAYYYNKDRDTAIANTKKLFGELLHIPIDYMAIINFDGFRKLVDALGGLTIDVDMDMRYTDSEDGTNIDLRKGLQTLDGKQTLDFVRYRKSNRGTEESTDLARNKRQQQVLDQLLGKLTSLNGLTQWGNVLDIIGQSVKTDIPESQLRQWIVNIRDMKPQTIDYIPIDGRWDSPYIVPSEEDFEKAIAALRTRIGLETGGSATGSGSGAYDFTKTIGLDASRGGKPSDGKPAGSGNPPGGGKTGSTLSPTQPAKPGLPQQPGGTTVSDATYVSGSVYKK